MSSPRLTSSCVARQLGVSRARVYQLDDELKPHRSEDGWRIYDASIVDAVLARRRSRAEARQRGLR